MIETKEHQQVPWPADATPADALAAARAALAAEWMRAGTPSTPDAISAFYRDAEHLGDDLAAWHATPERQEWTRMLVHVAEQAEARCIADIGAGNGHDLSAIANHYLYKVTDGFRLVGVEPNDQLRGHLHEVLAQGVATVAEAPLEEADLLLCIDVLEHVPDPEGFLGDIAQRAPVGGLLIEATGTHDLGTPLHLPANRGWHPGRCLERHGWELVDHHDRLHVWRRVAVECRQRAGLLLCAYRSVGAETMSSILGVCAGDGGQHGWRLRCKTGDGMISRSRGILATAWYRETADDVALFIDDDIVFDPRDADHLVDLCRDGHDIIVGAYPVHDGSHLAIRSLPDTPETLAFGPEQPPVEIMYGATGFMAMHRRVLDALIPTLRLQHADQPWSYYPLFPFLEVENPDTGTHETLSEDWGLCELARRAGFKVWLAPSIRLRHASTIAVSVQNMNAVHAAIQQA